MGLLWVALQRCCLLKFSLSDFGLDDGGCLQLGLDLNLSFSLLMMPCNFGRLCPMLI